jgi:hypothetical protein
MTAERVRELLDFDPQTGRFVWKVQLCGTALVGSEAGTIYKNGRRYIAIGRRRYFASRLAWLHFHGEWPPGQIDHRNLNRDDNRIENLRVATSAQNSANRGVLRSNLLGVKGVGISTRRTRRPQRYRARIRVNGKLLHLGYFDTPEAANDAYFAAARLHFGDFARAS